MSEKLRFGEPGEEEGVYWSPEIVKPKSKSEDRPEIDFRERLNPAQYEAVTTTEGPVLVVAGAGSGKTRTLVHRVAYLVQNGVAPEAILLLTFTRKAAQEMLSRAEELVGRACSRVSGGTFHSLAHILLRTYAEKIGYDASFGVMDRSDMEELLGRIRKQLNLGEKDRKFPKRSTLATIISKAVNKNVDLKTLIQDEYSHLSGYLNSILKIEREYSELKKQSLLMDFDDLLVKLAELLRDDESVRKIISSKYRYIMVDEYQDTNPVQAEIIQYLSQVHGNVMVVGDDAQSIYSFRGATFRNIMDFPEMFSGARVIKLEENYRSRQPILSLTNHIISQAREKYEKKLFTRREGGAKPNLITFETSKEQSLFVCRKIREYAARGVPYKDMAVLFRAASHSFDLELELLRHDIDFVKYGGRKFLESAHIKDLLAILKITATPGDVVSMNRALLLLDGIGPKSAGEIAGWIEGSRERLTRLEDYPARGKVKKSLQPLAELLESTAVRNTPFMARIDRTIAFYQPILETKFDDYPSRQKDIDEFHRMAEKYSSMTRFLTDMTLDPPNASVSGAETTPEGERLTLSTVHSAKGLEWKVVFILWASEGRFPAGYALKKPEDLDEERRLMYVAATRAEDHLYMLCPLESGDYYSMVTLPRPSRFLDAPRGLIHFGEKSEETADAPASGTVFGSYDYGRSETETMKRTARKSPKRVKRETPHTQREKRVDDTEFNPKDRVVHPVFGLGRVIQSMGGGKIRVDFDNFGIKTLHLEFAGLKRAE